MCLIIHSTHFHIVWLLLLWWYMRWCTFKTQQTNRIEPPKNRYHSQYFFPWTCEPSSFKSDKSYRHEDDEPMWSVEHQVGLQWSGLTRDNHPALNPQYSLYSVRSHTDSCNSNILCWVSFYVVSLCIISLNISFKGGELPPEEAGARLPQKHHHWRLQLRHPQEALHCAGSRWSSPNPALGEKSTWTHCSPFTC